ncbi:MAG TPA: hypothetical protein VF600_08700 [Abditibacteriaceae bacterium]
MSDGLVSGYAGPSLMFRVRSDVYEMASSTRFLAQPTHDDFQMRSVSAEHEWFTSGITQSGST